MKKKILLVEDEAILAMFTQQMLEAHVFEVVTVHNGEKAIEMVEEDPDICLILMDIDLGKGIDGTEAAEQILNQKDIPIVFLSSHTEPEVVEKTEGITSYGYIVKNSGETVLLASIKMAFRLFEAKMAHKQKEEDLRKSDYKYRMLFENMNASFALHEMIYDDNGDPVDYRFLEVNPLFEKYTGVKAAAVIGHTAKELFPNTEQHWIDTFGKVVKTGESITYQNYSQEFDHYYETFVFSPQENQFAAFFIDRSNHKRAEESLKKSEARFRVAQEMSPDGFTILHPVRNAENEIVDFTWRYENSSIARINGTDPQEVIGKQLLHLFPDHRNTPVFEAYAHVANTGETLVIEEILVKDILALPMWLRLVVVSVEKDIAILAQDITERKRIEEKYQSLFNYSNDAIFVHEIGEGNLPGRIIEVNDQACRLTQHSREELLQMSQNDIAPEKDLSVMSQRVKKLIEEKHLTFEAEDVRRDGSVIPVEISAFSYNEGGKDFVVSSVRDISERKQTEKALDQKTKLLEASQVLANLGSWEWDIAHDICSFSEQWKKIHGVSDNDLTTSELFELAHPEDAPYIEKAICDATGKGKTYDIEHRIIRADNKEIRYIKALGRTEFDQNTGRPVRIVGSSQDITERKQAQEDLIRSREQYILAVKGSNDGIWDWDILTNEVFFSEKWKEQLGYADHELENNFETFTNLLHPDDKQPVLDFVKRYLEGEIRVYNIELRLRHKDGSYRWGLAKGEAIRDEDGKPVRMAGSHSDITDRKQNEEELRKALKEKDYLMKELNHRVKNNLAMVNSLISIKASVIGDSIDLSDLSNQIEAIKIVHEKLYQTDDITHINLREYFEHLLQSIFSSFSIIPVKIDLEVEEILIETKRSLPIGLLINEIATNAIKYGFNHEDEAVFSVKMELNKNMEAYTLIVSNTGNSFPENINIDSPKTLGLRLITALVNQLNGTIELQKEPYPIFTIRFPL